MRQITAFVVILRACCSVDMEVQKIIDILSQEFPEPKSELNFNSPFELLVAVILSAQCTDKRVNSVTPKLFELADDAYKMSQLDVSVIEEIVRPCGFYHNKALFISNMSKDLVKRFNGQVQVLLMPTTYWKRKSN